jgi:polyhydroxyalkanoate synthesis regulator phasin
MVDIKFKINGHEIRTQRGIKDFFRTYKDLDLSNLKIENIENCCLLMGFDRRVVFKKAYDTLLLFSNEEIKGHKLSSFIREVGSECFCPDRYLELFEYRKENKLDSNSDTFWKLKFGKSWKKHRDEAYKNKPTHYNVDYVSEKLNLSKDEAIKYVEDFKKNKATSKENFLKKHGEKLGAEKFKKFQETSKHTKEKYVKQFGRLEGENKWDEYISVKKKTSKRSVEYWIEQGYDFEQAEELRKEFHRLNFNTSSVDYWVMKGISQEEAEKKVSEIFRKKTVKFGRASRESLCYFSDLKDFFEREKKEIRLGVKGNYELSIYDKVNKKMNFYDFSVPELKIIIEYHGERYHPNPERLSKKDWDNWKCYILNNKNNFKTVVLTADEKYELDQQKKNTAIESGYDYLEIWSYDNKEYNWNKIKKFLKTKNINYEN